MKYDDRYMAYMGLAPKRIPHWEHWSCPDAETYLTGIDYYEHPRQCRLKMWQLYPQLLLPVPENDDPIPRPPAESDGSGILLDEQGRRTVRWDDSHSWHWDWGKAFTSVDEVLAFSPLAQGDFTNLVLREGRDYSDEEKLYQYYRSLYPAEWGDKAPEGSLARATFYNTLFMWPLQVFGWDMFLQSCLEPGFARIMDEFAEISKRVFRVFARLPVNVVVCHDDIASTRGPTCSPAWLRRHIFPHYEEFFSILRAGGKRVIFLSDGCMDACADDVFACGAQGLLTEPYTHFKPIARKYSQYFLAGEGDNRILMRNDPVEIEAMVRSMVETAQICGGYVMTIGNLIPWNVPPTALKLYLDLSVELAHR